MYSIRHHNINISRRIHKIAFL